MKKFKKLSRDEMRSISGGVLSGCSCKNECTNDNGCPGQETCSSGASCMGSSPSCTYNVCVGKL